MKRILFSILYIFFYFKILYADITIERIYPEKIRYVPGEIAVIEVVIKNTGKETLFLNLSLEIHYGLDNIDKIQSRKISILPNTLITEKFDYNIPKDRKWGHEIIAYISDENGKILEKKKEYFTVGKNAWEVGHYITIFNLRGAKESGKIDRNIIPKWRKNYITIAEVFSWQPSVFDGMAPEIDIWRSGQGNYRESKDDLKYLIDKAHKNGMAVVTYYQSISYGTYGFEFARKHPDWLTYNSDGRPDCWFDVERLTANFEEPESQPYETPGGITTGLFIPSNSHVGDWWIDQVIKSVEMFGWDGIRSDGTPGPRNGYNYKGKYEEWEDLNKAEIEFVKKMRKKLTEKFPGFLFGWNNVAGGFPGGFEFMSRSEYQDVLLPDAYSLYEHFRSATDPRSPYYKWEKAVYYLQNEAEAIRSRGGFSHAGWMASNRYLEAIASACCVQVDTWSFNDYRRFEFRWSEFLWDNKLKYVRPGEKYVNVEGPENLWWKNFVHERDLNDGKKRIVIHLINMPKTDEDAWADRPPEPLKNIKLKINVPKDKKIYKIVALSPDLENDRVDFSFISDDTLLIPEIKIWTLVVAELK